MDKKIESLIVRKNNTIREAMECISKSGVRIVLIADANKKLLGAVIDEHIRHAITKLANIHFPANEKSAKHIIKMGENSEYVFPMGNPGIPLTYHLSDKRKKKIARKYNLNVNQPILLVIQHPITTQVGLSAFQIRETMEAVKELKMQAIVIYPNSDAGSRDIIKIIHEYKDLDFIRIYKNIEREDFIDLMALGSVIIGNSSCALIEAPSFNLPAVNIGMRQEGRERAENIIDVSYNKKEIKKAILKAIYDKKFKAKVKRSLNPYVKNGTEENIIKILKKIILSDFPKRKFLGN